MKEAKLGDLLHFTEGKEYQGHKGKPNMFHGEYPIYGSGGKMGVTNSYMFDRETILVPNKGTLNNIMYKNEPIWVISTLLWTKKKTEDIDLKYLYYRLKTIDYNCFNQGSTVPGMDTGRLKSMKITFPSLEEQIRIARQITLADKKTALLGKQMEMAIKYKEALLSRLIPETKERPSFFL